MHLGILPIFVVPKTGYKRKAAGKKPKRLPIKKSTTALEGPIHAHKAPIPIMNATPVIFSALRESGEFPFFSITVFSAPPAAAEEDEPADPLRKDGA